MRRLTIWITATLAIVALAIAVGMNSLGIGGKEGDDGDHGAPSTVQTPAPTTTSGPSDDGKTGGDTTDHENKPGENK